MIKTYIHTAMDAYVHMHVLQRMPAHPCKAKVYSRYRPTLPTGLHMYVQSDPFCGFANKCI